MTSSNITSLAQARPPASPIPRNDGVPLDFGAIDRIRVNLSAAERRVASLAGRRTVKKDWQAAWLVKAITCMDLTTLAGDDTPGRVRRLCQKARKPIRTDIADALGLSETPVTVGAVCVYHAFVETAVEALKGSGIPAAAVSTGFPAGHAPMRTKLMEIEDSVAAGAEEIDIVISRKHVLTSNWPALYEDVKAYRAACGPACSRPPGSTP